MKIALKEVTVRDLTEGYVDSNLAGVVGYAGNLDIRPPYQREFVYDNKQREAVLDTVKKNYPLNVMYWALRSDGSFEIIDGQQRTISICQYVANDFSIDGLAFQNLPKDKQDVILDYRIMVYVCEGEPSEKLEWFRVINIAGERLKPQELRNAAYTGVWLSDAKRFFSKQGCVAYELGKRYVKGSPINQDYLELALKWISNAEIEEYMSVHQKDTDAEELWNYFENVIQWVEKTFLVYRRPEMKGLPWGRLYNDYKSVDFDADELEVRISALMQDDDVGRTSGIYDYVLSGNESSLNIRTFSSAQKRKSFEAQNGACHYCSDVFTIEQMEADHITPWSKGGPTIPSNCQMLCKRCNRTKSAK